MDPRRLFSVRVPPRVVEHADFQFGDAAPRRFALHFGGEEFHIAIGPRIVATPLCYKSSRESLFRLLLSLLRRSG